MTLLNSAALPELYERLGHDDVAFVPFPALVPGGRYAGRLVIDSQGLAVPARAHQPELAARFLDLASQPEWVERLWSLAHQVPASRRLEPGAIDDPQRRRLYETWRQGEHAPFVGNLIPRAVRQRVLGSTLGGVLTGALPTADVPRALERACARWRRDHPAAVAYYEEWAASFPR
jgi:hypothetical protein